MRDWKQFHNPKNLATAIAIEASELQECFLWTSEKDSFEIAGQEAVHDELADIFNYILLFAETAGIDLERAFLEKLEKNEMKYPVEKAKGSSQKYTEL
ncbi:MAG TPA: nucleotide pyrophosphohydrolase [bacterium]|nr:nucleotide pyrophosphohydrolase [bacterium]